MDASALHIFSVTGIKLNLTASELPAVIIYPYHKSCLELNHILLLMNTALPYDNV